MSSGDSSSESVRALGQPAGKGVGSKEGWLVRGLDQLCLLCKRDSVKLDQGQGLGRKR